MSDIFVMRSVIYINNRKRGTAIKGNFAEFSILRNYPVCIDTFEHSLFRADALQVQSPMLGMPTPNIGSDCTLLRSACEIKGSLA